MLNRKEKRVSDKTLRDYYEHNSSLASAKEIKAVSMKFPKPRRLVALRLDEPTLNAVRHLAAQKGLNYSTLMRMWITERLHQE